MAAQDILREYPVLRQFVIPNVRPTGLKIGAGSYGSVEEVVVPGAICAAKKIHDIFLDRSEIPPDEIRRATAQFVKECQLMSTLRHPNIVQFLGVAFLPGSRLPALVMERLLTSLHDLLDPETDSPNPPKPPSLPLSQKMSILQNMARGLAYLHELSPPVIHRDLSARNILLDKGMVAKIVDLGVARIMPLMKTSATMTKGPGASVYMPPEAAAPAKSNPQKSKYDVSIDIFSFGVVTMFTIGEVFPCDPLEATYYDVKKGKVIGRSELQRRSHYMKEVNEKLRSSGRFRGDHPIVRLIQHCLHNHPAKRPHIRGAISLLEEARAKTKDEGWKEIQETQSGNQRREEELIRAKEAELRAKETKLREKEAGLRRKEAELRAKEAELMKAEERLEQQTQSKDRELAQQQLIQKKIVTRIRSLPGNDKCCDCGGPEPNWLSVNLGILICIYCSGLHQELSVQYSRIRSLQLDSVNTSELLIAVVMGNALLNEVLEANLTNSKPLPDCTKEARREFITNKYIHRKYIEASVGKDGLLSELLDAIESRDIRLLLQVYTEGVDLQTPLPGYPLEFTALHLAIELEDLTSLHIIQFLLGNGKTENCVDIEGNTPLHLAVTNDLAQCVKLLLLHKADFSIRNSAGMTAIDIAKEKSLEECLELLQDAEKNKYVKCQHIDVDWAVEDEDDEIYQTPTQASQPQPSPQNTPSTRVIKQSDTTGTQQEQTQGRVSSSRLPLVVVAEYDCSPDNKDELGFKEGEKIVVARKMTSDWWQGYVEGEPEKLGYFPVNYIQISTSHNLPPQ